MAGDQGIANAYARFFQAQEQENLMNDPFYQFTELATMAAQEWVNEKKIDKQRASKRADALQANMDEAFITAVDGYNPQTQQLAYDHLEVFTNRMDEAVKAGDKKLINQIYSESQEFSKQLRQGQELMKEHAKNLKEGTYSDGAGTATQNKFLSADMTDYETFMETNPELPGYGKLHFRIKDNDGGVQVFSMDQMDKYNVKRADGFGDGYDALIKKSVQEAANSGVYTFDKGQFEKLFKRSLADGDTLYSAFHDNIFGEEESIRDWFNSTYKANQDWQNIWNDKIPINENVVSGGQGVANSGYNEEAIRGITQSRLMEMAEKEFKERLNAYQRKTRANNGGGSDNIHLGNHNYESSTVLKSITNDIKNRQPVTMGDYTFVPLDNGGWREIDDKIEDAVDTKGLIQTLAKHNNMPNLLNLPMFRNLYKINNSYSS